MGPWDPEKNLLFLLSLNGIISNCLLDAYPYAHKYFISHSSSQIVLHHLEKITESHSWSEWKGNSYSRVPSSNLQHNPTVQTQKTHRKREQKDLKNWKTRISAGTLSSADTEKMLPDISPIWFPKQFGNGDSTIWLVNTNGNNLTNGCTPRTSGN